ncbi:MAG: OmpA family protein [Bradyrhizobium sp.]|nr:OmpA family protein [Bradyrhizobium sp.]
MRTLRELALLTGGLLWLAVAPPAWAQNAPTRDDIVAKLEKYQSDLELDVPALRQQVAERSKSRGKNEPPPQKRTAIAPDLNKLPAVNIDITFDVDTPIVQPESYQTVGRIADAMVYSSLLPYTFVIVGHIEANGKREANAILSQRRADAIREILVNTFKISAKRIQSVGLGEEQLLDSARPNAPVNNQIQIMTLAKIPETEQPAATPAAKKQPAKKKK